MTADTSAPKTDSDLGTTLGFLCLRLWLAVRAILTGIEKFAGSTATDAPVTIDGAVNTYGLTASESHKIYGLAHYNGVPEALYGKLEAEPLLPSLLLKTYDSVLGPLLIILGVTLLLGIASRVSLFLMGLVYISLTAGLILLKQDAGIAWLGVHVLMVAYALFNARYNRFELFRKY